MSNLLDKLQIAVQNQNALFKRAIELQKSIENLAVDCKKEIEKSRAETDAKISELMNRSVDADEVLKKILLKEVERLKAKNTALPEMLPEIEKACDDILSEYNAAVNEARAATEKGKTLHKQLIAEADKLHKNMFSNCMGDFQLLETWKDSAIKQYNDFIRDVTA